MTISSFDPRTVIAFADRLRPVLERIAANCHADDTISYSLAGSLIRRDGEGPVPARLIGKVLDDVAEFYDPNLVAYVVSKKTGEPGSGYWQRRGGVEMPDLDPVSARRLAHRSLCPDPERCPRLRSV